MRRIFAARAIGALLLMVGHANASPQLDDVRQAMIGTWQSLDDTRFTRELDADGSATDRYEGNADDAIKGNWIVFAGNVPPADAKGRKLVPTAVYLEVRQNDDTLFYGLTGLTAQSLHMVYLERGNALSFERIK